MSVKWASLNIITSVIVATVFIQQCEFAAPTRTSIDHITSNSPVSTECNLTHTTEAYCVPIRNCVTMLLLMNHSEVRARRCGPRNENVKNPYVCCEKGYIELEASLSTTSTQKTTTSRSSDQELHFKIQETVDDVILHASTEKLETLRPVQDKSVPSPQQFPVQDNFHEGCGVQNIDSRVLGGDPASRKEFPWLARLLRRDSQGEMIFSCSGSLITSKVVLTAAHCLAADILVAVGELHAVSLGEHETTCDVDADECLLNRRTVIVSGSVVYPRYNKRSKNHDNDIGLVFLRDKVKFTDYISPICLLQNTEEVSEYYLAGWGRTESGMVSGVKLKIAVPPFSWTQCAKRYNSTKVQLTSSQICAGGVEGMDACQGDSGGPLMVRQNGMRWYAAGIVSLGLGCGRKGWPGIYVYVPNYINWIKQTIRQRVS